MFIVVLMAWKANANGLAKCQVMAALQAKLDVANERITQLTDEAALPVFFCFERNDEVMVSSGHWALAGSWLFVCFSFGDSQISSRIGRLQWLPKFGRVYVIQTDTPSEKVCYCTWWIIPCFPAQLDRWFTTPKKYNRTHWVSWLWESKETSPFCLVFKEQARIGWWARSHGTMAILRGTISHSLFPLVQMEHIYKRQKSIQLPNVQFLSITWIITCYI